MDEITLVSKGSPEGNKDDLRGKKRYERRVSLQHDKSGSSRSNKNNTSDVDQMGEKISGFFDKQERDMECPTRSRASENLNTAKFDNSTSEYKSIQLARSGDMQRLSNNSR